MGENRQRYRSIYRWHKDTRNSESWNLIKTIKKEKATLTYIEEREWEKYYNNLFSKTRPEFTLKEKNTTGALQQLEIKQEYLNSALKSIKNRKSAGSGGLALELIVYGTKKIFLMIRDMLSKAINSESGQKHIYQYSEKEIAENVRTIVESPL